MLQLLTAHSARNLPEAFGQAVGADLREGPGRVVVVAHEIPASLQRLAEFLNEQMPRVRALGVSQQYRTAGAGTERCVPGGRYRG